MPLVRAELFQFGTAVYATPWCLFDVIERALFDDAAGVGTAALRALDASATKIASSEWILFTERPKARAPLIRAAGLSSLAEFEAAARYVYVDRTDGTYTLLHSKREKPGDGFSLLNTKQIFWRGHDPADIGAAIQRAFELCVDYVPPVVRPLNALASFGADMPAFAGLVGQTRNGMVEFVVRSGTPAASFVALLQWLPIKFELNFFDPNHPEISDPGAYCSVVRHSGGWAMHRANHGWQSDWEPQTIDRLAGILRAATDSAGLAKGGSATIEIKPMDRPPNVHKAPGSGKYLR